MLLVVLAPWYGFVLAGWALLGLGISGIVPQIFSAAGNLGGTHAAVTFSRIVGVGYVGFLAGPALIGFLGGAFGLTVAFILPLAFCLVGAVLASAVAKPLPRGVSDDAP
jgi:MFS family permease